MPKGYIQLYVRDTPQIREAVTTLRAVADLEQKSFSQLMEEIVLEAVDRPDRRHLMQALQGFKAAQAGE